MKYTLKKKIEIYIYKHFEQYKGICVTDILFANKETARPIPANQPANVGLMLGQRYT